MAARNFAHNKTGDFMKILVIFTGGTIGSTVSDGWISPTEDMKYLLISKYREVTGDASEFETVTPYTVLSENLSALHLNSLISSVISNISNYDGIIVTHGTDTIQYSAAALSFALGSNSIPVVLVSSNYPLEDRRSNGLDNFIAAVEFIKSGIGRGVFVSYKNGMEATKIHIGTRLLSHNENLDYLNSFDSEPYALYDGRIIKNENCICTSEAYNLADSSFSEHSGILVIQSLPGDSFSYGFDGIKAVILRPYHSGTLNTSSECLAAFCERAKAAGISVFVVNVHGNITYETSKEFENLGVTVLPMCAFPSVFVKLWLVSGSNDAIKELMQQNIANEYHNNA